MTDKTNATSPADETVQPLTGNGQPLAGSETHSSSIADLATALKVIDDLRSENAKHRKAKTEAERVAQVATEAQLANDKKWQELAESRAKELDRLKPIAEQHETITQAFNASLDNRLKQIPDDIRKKTVDPVRAGMTPVDFSNWLDANLDMLRARPAPNLNGGAGSTVNNAAPVLSAIELEMARAMGIAPDQYFKRKNEVASGSGSRITQEELDKIGKK